MIGIKVDPEDKKRPYSKVGRRGKPESKQFLFSRNQGLM